MFVAPKRRLPRQWLSLTFMPVIGPSMRDTQVFDEAPKFAEVAAGHGAAQVQAAARGSVPVPEVLEHPDR